LAAAYQPVGSNALVTSAGRWWRVGAGDIDGFFALALDNLIQLLVIVGLCRGVLGFGPDLLFGHVLPGAAVSILVGNLFYAYQAKKLAEKEGRDDVTALPYGINTVSLFAYVFLVMLPAKVAAQAAGLAPEAAARVAWSAGLAACLGSGLIEIAGAFGADWIRQHTPRAALLATLAGIAVSFIALGFLFKAFGAPIVGVTTLIVVMVSYFGRVRYFGHLPGGLVAICLGTLLAWLTGLASADAAAWSAATDSLGLRLPELVVGDMLAPILDGQALLYLAVIVPMGIVNIVGSLQNIESAAAAGDSFPTKPALIANGVGTVAAAAFGSCFPTTIYIGHPGWKAMGARRAYSVLNAVFVTLACLTGSVAVISLAVPIEAGMAIVVWIGIVIVAQAFEASPRRHMPAVAVGLLPGIAAWGTLMMKQGLRVGGVGSPGGPAFGPELESAFVAFDISARGAFALEQGFIFTAMILAAATTEIIDRRFRRAALWCLAGAVMSALGLMHAFFYTPSDTFALLGTGAGFEWAVAYLLSAAFLVIVPWISVEVDAPPQR
jgi:AGZA family xanthine/uracil permease-like MFS transporter